jgi:hypothetical protein
MTTLAGKVRAAAALKGLAEGGNTQ